MYIYIYIVAFPRELPKDGIYFTAQLKGDFKNLHDSGKELSL